MKLMTHINIERILTADGFLLSADKFSLAEVINEYKPTKQFTARVFDKKRLISGRLIRPGHKKAAWLHFPINNNSYLREHQGFA